MVFGNLRVDLGPAADMVLPLPLARIDGAKQAWQTTVVECNEFRCEQMSAKTRRNCLCIVMQRCRAGIS